MQNLPLGSKTCLPDKPVGQAGLTAKPGMFTFRWAGKATIGTT